MLQQFTGINSVMDYGTELLKDAKFSDSAAPIANITNDVMAFIGGSICLFFLIDRVRRRTIILVGLVATTACHGLIVLAAALLPDGNLRSYAVLASVALLVRVIQITLNVPAWLRLSDLFALRLRGVGMGFRVLVLWLVNALVAQIFRSIKLTDSPSSDCHPASRQPMASSLFCAPSSLS